MPIRILVIDDDVQTTTDLKRFLERAGYEVQVENDSTNALEGAHLFQPHVVILDYHMPTMHGGDVAWQLSSDPLLRGVKMIVCSGYPQSEISRALPPARIPIVEKPIDADALLQLIRESTEDIEQLAR